MSMPKIGDRVRAVVGAGGYPRPGVLTGILYGDAGRVPCQWFVTFDGDTGPSGPCYYIEPE